MIFAKRRRVFIKLRRINFKVNFCDWKFFVDFNAFNIIIGDALHRSVAIFRMRKRYVVAAFLMMCNYTTISAEFDKMCCDEHVSQVHAGDFPAVDILGECLILFRAH
jgi:hypothetical protein